MKTILFIEDEPGLQRTLGDVLRRNGYKVINALNGEIGLKLLEKEKPDLILLDLVLPKMNGFEVLKELKANPETKEIPVIVLTNLGTIEDVNRVVELGANTYLIKAQYTIEEVIQKVKRVMEE